MTLQEFMEMGAAFFKGGDAKLADLAAKLTASEARVKDLEQQLAAEKETAVAQHSLIEASNSKLTKLEADYATAIKERDTLAAQITDPAGAIQQAAAAKASAALASQGIPAAKLPETESTAETYEAVQKKLHATKDPAEKAVLAKRCQELRGHGKLFGK